MESASVSLDVVHREVRCRVTRRRCQLLVKLLHTVEAGAP